MIDGDIRLARYAVTTKRLAMVRIISPHGHRSAGKTYEHVGHHGAQLYIKQIIASQDDAGEIRRCTRNIQYLRYSDSNVQRNAAITEVLNPDFFKSKFKPLPVHNVSQSHLRRLDDLVMTRCDCLVRTYIQEHLTFNTKA